MNITKIGNKIIKKSDQLEKDYIFILNSINEVIKELNSALKQAEGKWDQPLTTLTAKVTSIIPVLTDLINDNPADNIKEKLEESKGGFIELKDSLIGGLFKSLDTDSVEIKVKFQIKKCMDRLKEVIKLISENEENLETAKHAMRKVV